MVQVRQIKIGKHQTGIVGLDDALKEMTEECQIKILGQGCPNCDRLEQDLMILIAETGIEADLEHIRDIREIGQYGVMGSPALVINGKVKVVGSVPSAARLREMILAADAEIKHQ
jgi:small redox-active disulfide protein 2